MHKLVIFLVIVFCQVSMGAALTINNSGLVELGDDISFNPSATNDSIIQISVSNVTLDLGERILSQGNTTANTLGIVVNDGLSNITITNGTIFNLTGTAIRVGQNCQNINISSINTFTCGGRGVEFNPTNGTTTFDCFLKNLRMVDVRSEGIYVGSNCARFVMDQLFMNRCAVNLFGINCNGAAASRINSITLSNIILSRCGSGVRFFHTDNSSILNAQVLDSSITGAFDGYLIQGSTGNQARGNVLRNCSMERVSATGVRAGFRLQEAGQNFLQNCRATYQNNSASTTRGFYMITNSQNNILFNCMCNNLFGTPVGGTVVGFDLSDVDHHMLIGCECNTTPISSSALTAYGFRAENTTDCTIFKSCSTIANHTHGFFFTNSNNIVVKASTSQCNGTAGFASNVTDNSIFDSCVGANSQGFAGSSGDGFVAINDVDQMLVVNCVANSNDDIGYSVQSTLNDNCVFADNLGTANTTGYENDAASTTVVNCTATNNTTGFNNTTAGNGKFFLNEAMQNGANYMKILNLVGPGSRASAGGNLN